jgi:hypothetical protein
MVYVTRHDHRACRHQGSQRSARCHEREERTDDAQHVGLIDELPRRQRALPAQNPEGAE